MFSGFRIPFVVPFGHMFHVIRIKFLNILFGFCLCWFSLIWAPLILETLRLIKVRLTIVFNHPYSNKFKNCWFLVPFRHRFEWFFDHIFSVFDDFDPKMGTRVCVLLFPSAIFFWSCSAKESFEGSLARFGSAFGSILVASDTCGAPFWDWKQPFGTRICRKHLRTTADTSRRNCFPFKARSGTLD